MYTWRHLQCTLREKYNGRGWTSLLGRLSKVGLANTPGWGAFSLLPMHTWPFPHTEPGPTCKSWTSSPFTVSNMYSKYMFVCFPARERFKRFSPGFSLTGDKDRLKGAGNGSLVPTQGPLPQSSRALQHTGSFQHTNNDTVSSAKEQFIRSRLE